MVTQDKFNRAATQKRGDKMSEVKNEQKKIQATETMKNIMAASFKELDEAAKNRSRKIAWCTSVGPAELLRSMGFLVYFPENHGAMLGSSRMAADLIPAANAKGFSPDICSYLTSDIGSYLTGNTPLKKAYGMDIPKPDVLVFNTNQCRDVKDWFDWYGREFNKPSIGVFTHRNIGDIKDYVLDDIAQQFKDLIPELERIGGVKFDIDRFRETVKLSRECSELWKASLALSEKVPSPWNFFDHTIHMGPAVVLRGTKEAVDYYSLLNKELNDRAAEGVSSIANEKHRIYWDGMPVWGKLRTFSDLFKSLDTCVVASTYCNSWIFTQLDENDPFKSMARAYTELFIARDEEYKIKYMTDIHSRYAYDGIIFHDAKTCPNNSNNRYGMPERLQKLLGVPTLTINGDLNDLRLFSEQQSITNVEAFIEQLNEMR